MAAPTTDGELVAQLRAALVPQGTEFDLVNLRTDIFYVPSEFIGQCLDTLEAKAKLADIMHRIGDKAKPLNALETLAPQVLTNAAHIYIPSPERVDAAP